MVVRNTPWGKIYPPGWKAAAPSPPSDRAAASKSARASSPMEQAQATRSPQRAAPSVLVVDPSVEPGTGVFRTLEAACREAKAGGIIELRANANQPIEEQEIPLDKSLTIRAAEQTRPRLRLAARALAGEARLFNVLGNASITLNGITLEVDGQANPDAGQPAVLFDCARGTSVHLESVRVGGTETPRRDDAVLFRIPASQDHREISEQPPTTTTDSEQVALTLEGCQVHTRGGLLVTGPQSYWSLVASNCFIVSQVPVVKVSGPSMLLADNAPSQLDFERSSFLLGDSLVSLAVLGESRPEPPRFVNVAANYCVFLGNGGFPLTHSSGRYDADVQQDTIPWQGENNLIAGFDVLFEYEATDEIGPMGIPTVGTGTFRKWDMDEWLRRRSLAGLKYYVGSVSPTDFPYGLDMESQTPPTPDILRKIGCPEEVCERLGVPAESLPPTPAASRTANRPVSGS